MNKKKKLVAGAASAAALAMVMAGTYAWFSTTDSVVNEFQTDAFDVHIVEGFDPDVPVNPDSNITKDVTVENSGNADVLVRVKLLEDLSLLQREIDTNVDKLKVTLTDSETAADGQIPALVNPAIVGTYTAQGSDWTDYTDSATLKDSGGNALSDNTIKVYQKKTTAEAADPSTGAPVGNDVYSYVAVKEITDAETNEVTYQMIDLKIAEGEASNPSYFTAQYAYNTITDADDNTAGVQTVVGALHSEGDTTLDAYLVSAGAKSDSKFHDSVILNMGENVSEDASDDTLADTDTWFYCKDDGYYYYTKVLKAGEPTESLLESVYFTPEMVNALQGADYKLTPVMESVQVNSDAAYTTWFGNTGDKIPDAEGTVSGNTLTAAKQMVANMVIGYDDESGNLAYHS